MPALKKQRYELFCTGIAKGLTPAKSYVAAGFSEKGAAPSAARLLRNANVSLRLRELQAMTVAQAAEIAPITSTEVAIEIEIAKRDGQVQAKWKRYKRLCQIMEERAAHYSDPNNEMVRRLTGTPAGAKPDLRKLPGIATGLVVIEMKLLGKTAVPVLKEDTALLRSMSALESEIAQLMGFLTPISINVDARQDNRQVNTQNVQIVRMVSSPADETGQW